MVVVIMVLLNSIL